MRGADAKTWNLSQEILLDESLSRVDPWQRNPLKLVDTGKASGLRKKCQDVHLPLMKSCGDLMEFEGFCG